MALKTRYYGALKTNLKPVIYFYPSVFKLFFCVGTSDAKAPYTIRTIAVRGGRIPVPISSLMALPVGTVLPRRNQ
ncbi:hypothetical protein MELB17_20751 [Marinobacter sp. ELB17]|nr:hypothetical protein MELB17_20751 [Marinobacter sp. ELB17]